MGKRGSNNSNSRATQQKKQQRRHSSKSSSGDTVTKAAAATQKQHDTAATQQHSDSRGTTTNNSTATNTCTYTNTTTASPTHANATRQLTNTNRWWHWCYCAVLWFCSLLSLLLLLCWMMNANPPMGPTTPYHVLRVPATVHKISIFLSGTKPTALLQWRLSRSTKISCSWHTRPACTGAWV